MMAIIQYFQNNLGATVLLISWICGGVVCALDILRTETCRRHVYVHEIIPTIIYGAIFGPICLPILLILRFKELIKNILMKEIRIK